MESAFESWATRMTANLINLDELSERDAVVAAAAGKSKNEQPTKKISSASGHTPVALSTSLSSSHNDNGSVKGTENKNVYSKQQGEWSLLDQIDKLSNSSHSASASNHTNANNDEQDDENSNNNNHSMEEKVKEKDILQIKKEFKPLSAVMAALSDEPTLHETTSSNDNMEHIQDIYDSDNSDDDSNHSSSFYKQGINFMDDKNTYLKSDDDSYSSNSSHATNLSFTKDFDVIPTSSDYFTKNNDNHEKDLESNNNNNFVESLSSSSSSTIIKQTSFLEKLMELWEDYDDYVFIVFTLILMTFVYFYSSKRTRSETI